MNRTDINAQRIKELSAGLQPCSAVPRLSSTIPACCPPGSVISSCNRSMEPLRLEKTSEFPNPPHCAHCLRPSVPHPRGSGAPPGMGPHHPSPGSCAVQHCSFRECIFPNIQPWLSLGSNVFTSPSQPILQFYKPSALNPRGNRHSREAPAAENTLKSPQQATPPGWGLAWCAATGGEAEELERSGRTGLQ